MMVQEIKQWMKLIKDQRERLLFYEQKLAETGSYMFTDPDLSPAVYDPMVMIPENPEDRTLEKIIALDREIDANRAENQKKSQKVRKKVDNWVDHAIFHESHEQRLEKKRDSFYKGFDWEPNVTFFDREEKVCVRIPELHTFVYGMSYERQEIRESLYNDWKPEEEKGFHVLLAHGGDEKHIPMDMKRIAEAGFDYLALGHIHKPQAVIRGKALYPGALEPIDRNDTGKHGYIQGCFDQGRIRLKFIPFARREYQNLLLTMEAETTQYKLEEMLKNQVMERGYQNIYRLILQGWRSPELILLTERLKKLGNIVEVLDESRPFYDLAELHKKYAGTLIGDFVEYFMDRELTVVEEKALYHGLQALLETSVLNRN